MKGRSFPKRRNKILSFCRRQRRWFLTSLKWEGFVCVQHFCWLAFVKKCAFTQVWCGNHRQDRSRGMTGSNFHSRNMSLSAEIRLDVRMRKVEAVDPGSYNQSPLLKPSHHTRTGPSYSECILYWATFACWKHLEILLLFTFFRMT